MTFRRVQEYLLGTLRGRLILSVAAIHAVMMTLFILDLTLRQRAMLLDNQSAEAISMTQSIALSAAPWIASEDVSGLQELVEAERNFPEMLFIMFINEHGSVLAHSDLTKRGLHISDLPRAVKLTILHRSPEVVDVVAPAILGDKHVGWVRIGLGQNAAKAKLEDLLISGVLYAFAAILIGSFVAWRMGRQITNRLYAIQETIANIRAGDHSARSSISGGDEAAMMAHEFNSMLDVVAERDTELRISEEKNRTLIQNIQAAVVVHDSDSRITSCNRVARELLGLTEEQLIGKKGTDPDWHFLHEDGAVMSQENYPANRVLATRQPVRGQIIGIHRTSPQHIMWVLVNADPVYGLGNEIVQVIVTFVDVTERKRVEETDQLLAAVVKHSDDAIITKDLHGIITSWNEGATHIYQYNETEALGKPINSLAPADYQEEMPKLLEKLRNGEHIKHYETVRVRKDGVNIQVSLTISPLKDQSGKIIGASTVARDISEFKYAEKEIRHLASFPQLAPFLVIEFDQKMQALYANPALMNTMAELGIRDPIRFIPSKWLKRLEGSEWSNREVGVEEIEIEGRTFEETIFLVPEERSLRIYATDIAERKVAEANRKVHLHFLESLDRVNQIMQKADALDQMFQDVLDEVMSVFGSDRAFLLYPCDPEAPNWSAPMERNSPEYPGMFALGVAEPTTPEAIATFNALLDSDGPIAFGPGTEYPLPEDLANRYAIKSQLLTAFYPKIDKPWIFGVHQCSHARIWTQAETRLFQEIGRRLGDAISSQMSFQDVHESELRYRALFENAPGSIWEEDCSAVKGIFDELRKQGVTDLSLHLIDHPEVIEQCAASVRVIDVNQAALALYEAKSKEELFGGLARVFVPETLESFRNGLISLWNGETEHVEESVMRSLNGNPLQVILGLSISPGYEDSLARVLVSQTNITERKKAEEALRDSETRYQTVSDNTYDWEFWINPNGAFNYVSPSVKRITGYTAKEFIEDPELFFRIIHAEDREIRRAHHNKALSHPCEHGLEEDFRIFHKNGSLRWIGHVCTPVFDRDSNFIGIRGSQRDITERKQAEEAIRSLNDQLEQRVRDRTVDLEAAYSELESFSYSVSHDLRAPLRSMDGFSLALIEDFSDVLDATGKDYLCRVRNASQRMSQLIDDILSLSRVSRAELKRENIDLSGMALKILKDLSTAQPERKIRFEVQENIRAYGDTRMLEIVLNNLLGNAWKFTQRDPAAFVEFGCSQANGETFYYVRDNGVGFDMTYASKLFGAFQRLHSASDFEGTGIGLATVQRIIRRHGGRIWAEGAVNKGATFNFSLGHEVCHD